MAHDTLNLFLFVRIFNLLIFCRLDERKRRKDFILERKLLHPDPFEKDLTPEEKDICRRYRVFMRFSSKEEHEDFLRSIIEEHRIVKRIRDLQVKCKLFLLEYLQNDNSIF